MFTFHFQSKPPSSIILRNQQKNKYHITQRDFFFLQTNKYLHNFPLLLQDHERLDERGNCFVLHNCNGTAHYMNIDFEENLNQLEKHWQRALYTSVYAIGVSVNASQPFLFLFCLCLRLSGCSKRPRADAVLHGRLIRNSLPSLLANCCLFLFKVKKFQLHVWRSNVHFVHQHPQGLHIDEQRDECKSLGPFPTAIASQLTAKCCFALRKHYGATSLPSWRPPRTTTKQKSNSISKTPWQNESKLRYVEQNSGTCCGPRDYSRCTRANARRNNWEPTGCALEHLSDKIISR
jgi:hypothetical protein